MKTVVRQRQTIHAAGEKQKGTESLCILKNGGTFDMLTHEKRRGTVTVRLTGDLDHNTAANIREELDRLIEDPGVRRLVFDLSELGFMDSSGIGMMIGRYKMMVRRGGSVAVRPGGRQMDRLMELSGLYQIIEKLA